MPDVEPDYEGPHHSGPHHNVPESFETALPVRPMRLDPTKRLDPPMREQAIQAPQAARALQAQPDRSGTKAWPEPEPELASRPYDRMTRTLPFSQEAEDHVLGAILTEGDGSATTTVIDRGLDAGLTTSSFHDPRNALVWSSLAALRSRNEPLGVATLMQSLGPSLVPAGGVPRLLELGSAVPTVAHAGFFIEQVIAKERLRALIRVSTHAVEHAYNGMATPADVQALLDETRENTERLATSKKSSREQLKALETRRVRASTAPKEPVTRLFLAGKPIATPGNLITLISRAKTGKTATIGAAVAAIIAAHHDRTGLDTLKFTSPHTREAVVLIDTEQSPFDAYSCYQRAMKRAAQSDDPAWLCHYALVGYGAAQLREALPLLLDSARKTHGGVFMLILDGVADFVDSVNDEAECNNYISALRALSVEYDCPVLCVIHSNEAIKAGDDGRGHLGKQLTRKAESNLLLKKTGEVTTITSEKQRKAPITEADKVAFKWSEELQMHALCDVAEPAGKGGRPSKYRFEEFTSIFAEGDGKPKTRGVLAKSAHDLTGIKDTAFKDLLYQAVKDGRVLQTGTKMGYFYSLAGAGAVAASAAKG